jgi:transposase
LTKEKIFARLDSARPPQPGEDFFLLPGWLALRTDLPISPLVAFSRAREGAMNAAAALAGVRLESLEVGAAPLIRHFLRRLGLEALFARRLPKLPGRQPAVDSATVLCVLLSNLLLARQPLYALPAWIARRVPEHLGLTPEQTQLLNDDRFGRALDHLRRADRASLLTDLVVAAVREFSIQMDEFHQDTTTVTFSGAFNEQPPPEEANRPPRITFGYNKDHRPDLKQLLYSITVSADGAVPVHCKLYDGNTSDDQVHLDTWKFLKKIIGHSNFLYVADSKLCSRDNMGFIAGENGRFLTVMPKTRNEDGWFRKYVQEKPVGWVEVYREPNPRRRQGPAVVYHAMESPQRSSEGYRVLWYRSSLKAEQDCQARQGRLERARAWLEDLRTAPRRGWFASAYEARQAGQQALERERVDDLLSIEVDQEVHEIYEQIGRGRPGPNTSYRKIESKRYRPRFVEDPAALTRAALCDGLFPLMTNDKELTLAEALGKYKYQPFVEKRHEQLKSGLAVTPMWLKNVGRVESMLWLYYAAELVEALIEREVRRRMEQEGRDSLALYPEGRPSEAPTTALVVAALEGQRRHRLLDEQNQELRRFHDELPDVAREVLELLGVDDSPYGVQ